jgi:hypothetical protein
MTSPSPTAAVPDAPEDATAGLLRRVLLGLAALTVLGTAIELVTLHHWEQATQLVAFACLLALAVPLALLAGRPSARAVRAARIVAGVVCVAAAFGMWEHVEGNYDAGPLDAVYGPDWETMSAASRWWAALVKTVGPSPALAPGVLVLASLCVLGATLRHPALATTDR